MSRDKAALKERQFALAFRFQTVAELGIQTYISTLRETHGKSRMSLRQGRKLIDQAMGKRILTGILCEARQDPVPVTLCNP